MKMAPAKHAGKLMSTATPERIDFLFIFVFSEDYIFNQRPLYSFQNQ